MWSCWCCCEISFGSVLHKWSRGDGFQLWIKVDCFYWRHELWFESSALSSRRPVAAFPGPTQDMDVDPVTKPTWVTVRNRVSTTHLNTSPHLGSNHSVFTVILLMCSRFAKSLFHPVAMVTRERLFLWCIAFVNGAVLNRFLSG